MGFTKSCTVLFTGLGFILLSIGPLVGTNWQSIATGAAYVVAAGLFSISSSIQNSTSQKETHP